MSIKEEVIQPYGRIPLLIETAVRRDLAAFVQEEAARGESHLLEHGALLFRNFQVNEVEDFGRFAAAVSPKRLDYVYGSTPRSSLGDRIFTATEYPAAQEIPLHNENSYQSEWPLRLALCCLTPAASGGATPIADMRRVCARLGEALLDNFELRRVRYVRHYRPYVDVPWQQVFQTDSRDELARFCDLHEINHEWLDEQTLRTSQRCQGTARHPVTGERVLFNQAHLFHVSSVGAHGARLLIERFGSDRLPRQSYYGDGGELPLESLEAVRDAFRAEAVDFAWQAGDVLLLDNMQVAHGRRSFKGTRKVIAALMDPHSQ